MLHTTNQFIKFHTSIFKDCFDLWNSTKYATVHKGIFYSHLSTNHKVQAKQLIVFLEKFKFDVEVIQKLGAAQNEDKKMLYDESFLNMLQRFDIEKSVKFMFPDTRTKGNPVFIAKASRLQLQILEVIICAIWGDVLLEIEDN